MREPDEVGKVGNAWRSSMIVDGMVDMWFINLPDFHPMLRWFAVCEWFDSSVNTTTVYTYAVDPESYLFQDIDVDDFNKQKISFLPTEIVKHDLPKVTRASHAAIVESFVKAFINGQLQPDEEKKQELANFLTNAEHWVSK